MRKKKWRTRTRGTPRQKGTHFILKESHQSAKRKLPRIAPRPTPIRTSKAYSKREQLGIRRFTFNLRFYNGQTFRTTVVEDNPLDALDIAIHRAYKKYGSVALHPKGITVNNQWQAMATQKGSEILSTLVEAGTKGAEIFARAMEKEKVRKEVARAERELLELYTEKGEKKLEIERELISEKLGGSGFTPNPLLGRRRKAGVKVSNSEILAEMEKRGLREFYDEREAIQKNKISSALRSSRILSDTDIKRITGGIERGLKKIVEVPKPVLKTLGK